MSDPTNECVSYSIPSVQQTKLIGVVTTQEKLHSQPNTTLTLKGHLIKDIKTVRKSSISSRHRRKSHPYQARASSSSNVMMFKDPEDMEHLHRL